MKFLTLYNKLGKQPISRTKKQDVYVVDFDGKRKEMDLKFDTKGVPYFVFTEHAEFKE